MTISAIVSSSSDNSVLCWWGLENANSILYSVVSTPLKKKKKKPQKACPGYDTKLNLMVRLQFSTVQSAGAVEYTDCISAEV